MRLLLALLFFATLMQTAAADDFDGVAGIEYFRWEEFDDTGRKLLEEAGPRYFFGLSGSSHLDNDWLGDISGRFYSGMVDYDGETISGIPITTTTDYIGAKFELGFTREGMKTGGDAWRFRFALGHDLWRRSLQNTSLADGTPVYGYTEHYYSTYAKLGAAFNRDKTLSVGGGVKLPVYVQEEIDLGYGTLILHPEGKLSLFADIVTLINAKWSVVLGYDSFRFAKSEPVDVGPLLFWQPESTQDTLSLAASYRF